MEDLRWEVAHRELNVPSQGPPLGHWGTLAGDRDPDNNNNKFIYIPCIKTDKGHSKYSLQY